MLEWLAAAAGSTILGSSTTPGMMQRIRDKMQNKSDTVKQRTYSSADIQCVAAAIAVREAALSAGAKTHGDAVASAYTARATALGNAYAQTGGNNAIKQAVKKSWDSFKDSIRTARKNWQAARDAAWAKFRTAIKACKAPGEVLDTDNNSSEPKGE